MGSRLLLVDDSPFVLDTLARIAEGAGLSVVGRAAHGMAALDLAEALRPDVVSLDVDMPVMNGLATLKHLMTRRPVPVVMVSALTAEESPVTFECLRLGAVDFVEKASGTEGRGLPLQREEIAGRLRAAAAVDVRRLRWGRLRRPLPAPARTHGARPRSAVAAAAGRSGMAPLLALLNGLPGGLGASLIVSLDLRAEVVRAFAGYAARFSGLAVHAPSQAVPLLPDVAYLVPAARPSLVVLESGAPWLVPVPAAAGTNGKNAVTHLLRSTAETFPSSATGLLLAGAPPGAEDGLRELRRRRRPVLAQSADSSVDPAPLERAARAGLPTTLCGLDALVPELVRLHLPPS